MTNEIINEEYEYIFVFGTLRKGWGLNTYLDKFEYKGIGYLKDFEMYSNGHFPMIKDGKGVVTGEVYQIKTSNADYKILDMIESAYTRTLKGIKMEDGEKLNAFVYIYDGSFDGLIKIKSGDWNKQHNELLGEQNEN